MASYQVQGVATWTPACCEEVANGRFITVQPGHVEKPTSSIEGRLYRRLKVYVGAIAEAGAPEADRRHGHGPVRRNGKRRRRRRIWERRPLNSDGPLFLYAGLDGFDDGNDVSCARRI